MDNELTKPLAPPGRDLDVTLRIAYDGREFLCGRDRPVVRYGRARDNDLLIDDEYASRRHGEILHRSGRFFVTDHSSNGTLLVRDSGQATHFQGETFALDGAGSLRCGHREGPSIDFIVTERGASGEMQTSSPRTDHATRRSDAFYREGEYWTLLFEGAVLRLKHAKGLGYLAQLLRHPNQEIHVLDLVAGGFAQTPAPARDHASDISVDCGSGAGASLDGAARAQYQRRVQELRDELENAERCNDPGRAEAARAEMEFIADELAGSVGLGGRNRETASNAERARIAVTLAIKSSLEKIRNCHPALGAHLRMSIKRGRFCSYEPDPTRPVAWTLDG